MSFLDSIPRIVGTVADALPIVASEPLHDALDVQRERAAAQSRTEHAREPDACDPLPLAASGISAIVADDKRGQVLHAYRAPRWPSMPTGPRADDIRRTDRLADAASAALASPLAELARCAQRPFPQEAPEGLLPLFVAGDDRTWQALRAASARGIRARIVRTDGSGEVATDRWQPVEPDGPEVSEAMALAWRRASGARAWKRAAPTTTAALVGYVRAIVRSLARGPEARVGKRRAAAHAALARASERSAAQVAEDREEACKALARAVAQTRADRAHGARSRRRLADVAQNLGIATTSEPVPAS